jgi:hypothetical protein
MSLLKRLAKPLIPVILPIALAIAPQAAHAQNKVYIEAGAEMFSSFEKGFQDAYGMVPLFDLGVGYRNGNNATELDFKFNGIQSSDSFNSVTRTENFSFGELDLKYIRFFGNAKDISAFIGAQGSLDFIRDTVDYSTQLQKTTAYDSGVLTGFGGGIFAGVDMPVQNNLSFFGEVGFNYATIAIPSGGNFNAGGLFAKIGSKYSF